MITLNTVDLIHSLNTLFQEAISEVFYLENTRTEEIYPYLVFSYAIYSDQIYKKNIEIDVEVFDDKKLGYERSELITSKLIKLIDDRTLELEKSTTLVQLDSIILEHEKRTQTDFRKKSVKIKGRIN
ncbi:hypothetical protein [Marinilactibacillus kalidii]|uniref:hypothetical protein n=1 Tax=Marinilactibacillus kalidii TaxID=2820274 RepID=UPI001ABE3A51|nr:hypothetical protein [Marinilactibacillus kalidii]